MMTVEQREQVTKALQVVVRERKAEGAVKSFMEQVDKRLGLMEKALEASITTGIIDGAVIDTGEIIKQLREQTLHGLEKTQREQLGAIHDLARIIKEMPAPQVFNNVDAPPVDNSFSPVVEVDLSPVADAVDRMMEAFTRLADSMSARITAVEKTVANLAASQTKQAKLTVKHSDGTESIIERE